MHPSTVFYPTAASFCSESFGCRSLSSRNTFCARLTEANFPDLVGPLVLAGMNNNVLPDFTLPRFYVANLIEGMRKRLQASAHYCCEFHGVFVDRCVLLCIQCCPPPSFFELTLCGFPLQNVQWMDAATKAEALLKINALSPLVGRQDAGLDDRWKQLVPPAMKYKSHKHNYLSVTLWSMSKRTLSFEIARRCLCTGQRARLG